VAEPFVWSIPAAPFRDSYDRFRAVLMSFARDGGMLNIARIFEMFPFSQINLDFQTSVVARGMLEFKLGHLSNTGDPVDTAFSDDRVGKVGLYVPNTLDASYNVKGSNIILETTGPDIFLIFFGMPAEFGITSRVVLTSLDFGPTSYDVRARDDNGKELIVRVDFALPSRYFDESITFRISPSVMLSFMRELTLDGGCTGLLTSGKWVINRDDQSICWIQREDACALGTQIAGPYNTHDEADAARQQLIQVGTCLG
jgi:hypothetical protein